MVLFPHPSVCLSTSKSPESVNIILYRKKDFVDVLKYILRWGDYPGLCVWPQGKRVQESEREKRPCDNGSRN